MVPFAAVAVLVTVRVPVTVLLPVMVAPIGRDDHAAYRHGHAALAHQHRIRDPESVPEMALLPITAMPPALTVSRRRDRQTAPGDGMPLPTVSIVPTVATAPVVVIVARLEIE